MRPARKRCARRAAGGKLPYGDAEGRAYLIEPDAAKIEGIGYGRSLTRSPDLLPPFVVDYLDCILHPALYHVAEKPFRHPISPIHLSSSFPGTGFLQIALFIALVTQ